MGASPSTCCQGADKERDKELVSPRGVAPTTNAEEPVAPSQPTAPAAVAPAAAPPAVTPVLGAGEFRIKVNKANDPSGGKLGIDVDLADGVTLHVDKVTDGMIAEWNKQNPDAQVQKGDRVLSINGTSGNAQQLTQVCRRDEILEMVLRRGEAEA